MKNEVIISENFQKQLQSLNILDHVQKKCTIDFAGSIVKLDEGLYILKDKKGKDVCGILDCNSFMEALLDTDIAHLWAYDNRKKIGTAN